MATVQSVLYDVRALFDEYNENGIVIPESESRQVDNNALRFINMAINEVYDKTRNLKTYNIIRKPTPNLLGDGTNMEVMEFTGNPYYTIGVAGAKSYNFECGNDFTVKVQEEINGSWVDLSTISGTPTEPTRFKGLISTSNATNLVRLVFTGATYYRFSNVALFAYPFKLNDIPVYRAWVPYELPSDFGALDKVLIETPPRQYYLDGMYKFEGYNEILLDYDFNGEMRVIYSPKHVDLTAFTDELPINNPKAIEFVKYYTAAKVAIEENPSIANYFEQKAAELKFEATKSQPAQIQYVTDVYR